MQSARDYFDYLNHAYLAVHKTKEDLFWATYMATSDDHEGFARAESAYKEFIADPAKLAETRDAAGDRRAPRQPGAERDALLHGLDGWLARLRGQHHRQPGRPHAHARDRGRRVRALRAEARTRAAPSE